MVSTSQGLRPIHLEAAPLAVSDRYSSNASQFPHALIHAAIHYTFHPHQLRTSPYVRVTWWMVLQQRTILLHTVLGLSMAC